MTQHHDETRAEAFRGEFNAADLRWRHDVARHADHEKITQSLVEDDLDGHARVGATENHGEGFLAGDELHATHVRRRRIEARRTRHKAAITFPETLERFARRSRDHECIPWFSDRYITRESALRRASSITASR
jgi:hypothetical protein